jgi:hypothetical protein
MATRADWSDVGDQWVDAGPFRAQLRYLMASGSLSVDDVAAVAGISARLADRLLHGRNGRPVRRISPETARRLIQVSDQHVQALRRIMVPPLQQEFSWAGCVVQAGKIRRSPSGSALRLPNWSHWHPVQIPAPSCLPFD